MRPARLRFGLLGLLLVLSGRVAAQPVPSAPEGVVQADAALVDLDRKLTLLLAGELSDDVPLDSLFSVRLDDRRAVAQRAAALEDELIQLAAARVQLEQTLAAPEVALPPPQAPPELSSPPQPPVEPSPPAPPADLTDAGPPDSKSGPDHARPADEDWNRQMTEYEAALARHASAQKAWQELEAAHEAALSAHREELAKLVSQTRRALADAIVRERIAASRLKILSALSRVLSGLPGPAVQALVDLAAPRTALRARAAALRELSPALSRLQQRMQAISDRVAGGGLVGLQVQRDEAGQQARLVAQRAELLVGQLIGTATQLEALALDLEDLGRQLRRTILLALADPRRRPALDGVFLEHLDASRQLAKRTIPASPVVVDPAASTKELDALAAHPDTLGTASDADQASEEALARLDRLDAAMTSLQAGLDRWRQAFEREAVTVLAALASDATRSQAYSLSGELLSDLQADLAVAWDDLQAWARARWRALQELPAKVMTPQGGWWLFKLGLAIALLVLLALLRRRIAGLALSFVKFARGRSAFRNSLAGLVRWAGLLQAVLPTLAFLAIGYLALWLIGLDAPEVAFIEVAFFWLTLYFLGRQILLGLTRRVSRGRPALLSASDETARLLRVTYGRVGLFLAIVAVAARWGRGWLGAGTLSMMVQWVAWLWVAGWALWAAFAWRRTLGATLARQASEGSVVARAGRFIEAKRYGALLSPIAFAYLCGVAVVLGVRKLLALGGVFAYLRALALKRLSRKVADKPVEAASVALPAEYTKEFPLYPILGDEEAALLPRADLLEGALEQIAQWRPSGKQGSLVLVGEKGSGKTTLLAMLTRAVRETELIQHTISKKRITEKGLMAELSPVLGLEEPPTTVGPLAAHLNQAEPKIVLVDEAHNLFLRKVDGYRAFDALVRLVNFTAERVFWILSFNSFAWEFVNQSRNRLHYFRKLVSMRPWNAEDLQELISRRNKRAGFKIELDTVLLDAERGDLGGVELVETTEGFFRLLHEASGGNPRVATYLWLNALVPKGEAGLRLGLFRQESTDHLQGLDPELLFALAAICQHENLSVDELRQVLNVSLDFAGFAARFLTEYGYTEPKHTDPRRVTLAPRFYPQVLRVLRARHLLYEKE